MVCVVGSDGVLFVFVQTGIDVEGHECGYDYMRNCSNHNVARGSEGGGFRVSLGCLFFVGRPSDTDMTLSRLLQLWLSRGLYWVMIA